MTSRLAISYLIFSQHSKIPVAYQISLLGQKAPANKVNAVGQRPDFLHLGPCCWIGNGGEGGGESLKKAEQAWPLQQLCTPRPLPRRHDPEPLGGAVAGRISEILKGRRGGAWAISSAVGRNRGIFPRQD
jgi:hypothetical protein